MVEKNDKSMKVIRAKLKVALGAKDFNDFKAMVDKVERSVPTTKNHYGRYMALLSKFPPESRLTYANFFIIMGGSRQGITDALRIIGHKKLKRVM